MEADDWKNASGRLRSRVVKASDEACRRAGGRHLAAIQRQVRHLEKSYEFILVAWRAVIERQLGREIASVVQGGSGSRQTGIGL